MLVFNVVSGVTSLYIGSFSAFQQTSISRFLIFSSTHHVGFLIIAFVYDSTISYYVLCFYLLTYVWSLHVTFSSLSCLAVCVDSPLRRITTAIRYLGSFTSLFSTNFFFCGIVSILFFSLAGIPPLLGFFSKLYIFEMLGAFKHYPLLVCVIFISFISCYYYLRIINTVWFVFDWTLYQHTFLTVFHILPAVVLAVLFVGFVSSVWFLELGNCCVNMLAYTLLLS